MINIQNIRKKTWLLFSIGNTHLKITKLKLHLHKVIFAKLLAKFPTLECSVQTTIKYVFEKEEKF